MANIKSNPFFILKLECYASRRDIAAAVEELDFIVGSDICSAAQNELTSPTKRLSAEVDWFPNASAALIGFIRSCIENDESIPVEALSGLSKLTAMQYNLSLYKYDNTNHFKSIIVDLDNQFAAIDANTVLVSINDLHRKAGIVEVTVSDIERELNRKRDTIRQQLSEILHSINDDVYVQFVSALVKETIEPASNKAGVIIYDVVDQYEIWAKAKIETLQSEIKAGIQEAKDNCDDDSALERVIGTLTSKVNAWHKLTYPLEILINKTGIDHSEIQSTAYSLRNLCLYLHNEKGKTKSALELTKKLRVALSSLAEVSERLTKDEDDLSKIQKKNEEFEREERANRQADKEYIVRINGDKFAIPPLCTCCLKPTTNKENVQYSASITRGRTTSTKTISVQMPLCPECEAHRKKFSRKSKLLCFWCILFGVVASFLAFIGFKAEKSTALYIGAGVTFILYFLINSIAKVKPLSDEHSTRLRSVQLCASLIDNNSRFVSTIPSTTFTFSNWKYAHLFQNANSSTASSVSSTSIKLNSAKRTSVFSLKEHKIGSLFGVLCLFVILAAIVVNIDYKQTFDSFDLRPVFGISSESRSSWGKTPQATSTPKPKTTNKPVATTKPSTAATKPTTVPATSEKAYSILSSIGDKVYVDIVSIEPSIGIGTKNSTVNTHIVCECKTSANTTVWVYMSLTEYKNNIDSSAVLSNSSTATFQTIKYSPAARIHGTVSSAEALCTGLSTDISSTKAITFKSIDKSIGTKNNTGTSATKAPSIVVASNGKMFITPDYEGVCPFTIIADSSTDYYIYLKYQKAPTSSTESRLLKSKAILPYESDVAFYLKAGQQVKIQVPIGVYKLYYATGSNFYGTKLLFGDKTHYYASDDLLSFYSDSQYYNGHTITLKTTYNGNFDTDPISESEFPTR